VLRGTQATAPKSGFFPPILSRHGRDAPPGLRIFLFSFHPLDWEKTLFIICPAGGIAVRIGKIRGTNRRS
jgi:hypothetical protein